MRLDDVLRGVTGGVQYDSRRVGPGDCFVAMRGGSTDGSLYIERAVLAGASVVVMDSAEAFERERVRFPGVRFYRMERGRRALAEIAAEVLGHPERALKVSAVTGTNGKTTTAWLLEQMLRAAGRRCVLVGTIETHVGEEVRASEHTTPEASDLLGMFADGVRVGATEAVMEMSSHALEQERVWGVPVDVGIWTNLTQDHLDYHGTMEAYFEAKARLFAGVGAEAPRVAVVNEDDVWGRDRLLPGLIPGRGGGTVMRYGMEDGGAEYRAEGVRMRAGETSFVWKTPAGDVEVRSPLTGRVNVYNLLAAGCAALARGMGLEEVAEAAAGLRQVPGRFQTVPNGLGITVVVDYAHTEDALRNLTGVARGLVAEGGGRVITVFGCGGDRDRTKRPKMGRAAGEGSDFVVVTSDNPRSEEPGAILAEVLPGVRETRVRWVVEEDRGRAMEVALREARAGDVVLIAGKGHETGQSVEGRVLPFDDVEVAAGVLRRLEGRR